MMIRLGFDERWVTLTMETIQSTSYPILINGEPKGFIKPTSGIKQGDLLSLYLFLLCVEGLSAMLRRVEEQKKIQGMYLISYSPKIAYCSTKPRLRNARIF